MSMHDERATINWYRTPIPRERLKELNARSDFKGFVQAGGFLGLWMCTGAATLACAFTGNWICVPILLFLQGTVANFNINAVHELCHNTVFKSKWLNEVFVRIFSLMGWSDWVWFNASHANHHRYTLHPPRDSEVVLPLAYAGVTRKSFWRSAIFKPMTIRWGVMGTIAKARGQWSDEWTLSLFPKENKDACRRLINWNRTVLAVHGTVLLGSIITAIVTQGWAWLIVPVVVSFSHSFGGWLLFLCNNTQHIGLTDKVPDFRMGARSVKLPLIASFLYWRMEYHIEHHMYAAVPCYNLPKLRKEIVRDLPERKGLVAAWQEIGEILKKQAEDSTYQYLQDLPETAHPYERGDREHEIEAVQAPPFADDDCDDLTPQ